jgi:hypothetical protein
MKHLFNHIIFRLFGKKTSRPKPCIPMSFTTTLPDEPLPFNDTMKHIHSQAK